MNIPLLLEEVHNIFKLSLVNPANGWNVSGTKLIVYLPTNKIKVAGKLIVSDFFDLNPF